MVSAQNLSTLRRGETIEARHPWSGHYRGKIESLVPHKGILWIQHGPFNERKLIDSTEYQIWRSPG